MARARVIGHNQSIALRLMTHYVPECVQTALVALACIACAVAVLEMCGINFKQVSRHV